MANLLDLIISNKRSKDAKELQEKQIAHAERMEDLRKRNAMDLRDSDELAKRTARQTEERDLQQSIADRSIARGEYQNDPSLSAEQNRALAMIEASGELANIKASRPLEMATSAENRYRGNVGARQYAERMGEESAKSIISGEEAKQAGDFLLKQVHSRRAESAPEAARAEDVQRQATSELAAKRAGLQMQDPTSPLYKEIEAQAAKAESETKKANYERDRYNAMQPASAASAENAFNQFMTLNPALGARVPDVQQAAAIPMLKQQGLFQMPTSIGSTNIMDAVEKIPTSASPLFNRPEPGSLKLRNVRPRN